MFPFPPPDRRAARRFRFRTTIAPRTQPLQLSISFAISSKMPGRTSLLINCSVEEALTIRARAKLERRGISGYVLNIVMRSVDFEEKLLAKAGRLQTLRRSLSGTPIRPVRPRTTMLVRCSTAEARRIRRNAKRRDSTISGFVLHCLRRSWSQRSTSAVLAAIRAMRRVGPR